jgi:hypothetical protein
MGRMNRDTPELQALAERCQERLDQLAECPTCFAPEHNIDLVHEPDAIGCRCGELWGEGLCYRDSNDEFVRFACDAERWTAVDNSSCGS